jgi:hypothetical protein
LSRPPVAATVQHGGRPLPGGPQAGLTDPVAAAGLLLQPEATSASETAASAGAPAVWAAQPPVGNRDIAAVLAGCQVSRLSESTSLTVIEDGGGGDGRPAAAGGHFFRRHAAVGAATVSTTGLQYLFYSAMNQTTVLLVLLCNEPANCLFYSAMNRTTVLLVLLCHEPDNCSTCSTLP